MTTNTLKQSHNSPASTEPSISPKQAHQRMLRLLVVVALAVALLTGAAMPASAASVDRMTYGPYNRIGATGNVGTPITCSAGTVSSYVWAGRSLARGGSTNWVRANQWVEVWNGRSWVTSSRMWLRYNERPVETGLYNPAVFPWRSLKVSTNRWYRVRTQVAWFSGSTLDLLGYATYRSNHCKA